MVPPAPTEHQRREPLAAILLLIVVLGLIVTGIILALRMGFQGYQNTAAGADLVHMNDRAVQFLNRNDYVDAFPVLNSVVQRTTPGTPLYATAMHNMGTYYLEAAQDARAKGDLVHAREDFQRAFPLLPERQNEISASLQSMPASTQSFLPEASAPAPPAAGLVPSANGAAALPESKAVPASVSAMAPASAPSGASAATDEQTTYNQAFAAYRNGIHAEGEGHSAEARSDYTSAVNRASYLAYPPPWATDAKSRLQTLNRVSAPVSTVSLPSVGAGF
ncbi:MAG: hypothetical protein LC772_09545 [Chloroflexi bacterium]|nr:hypothetical protein [Chloroflexota bacterium]